MEKNLKEIEKIIDHNFKKIKLLEKALTHKSFDNIYNNEKIITNMYRLVILP